MTLLYTIKPAGSGRERAWRYGGGRCGLSRDGDEFILSLAFWLEPIPIPLEDEDCETSKRPRGKGNLAVKVLMPFESGNLRDPTKLILRYKILIFKRAGSI